MSKWKGELTTCGWRGSHFSWGSGTLNWSGGGSWGVNGDCGDGRASSSCVSSNRCGFDDISWGCDDLGSTFNNTSGSGGDLFSGGILDKEVLCEDASHLITDIVTGISSSSWVTNLQILADKPCD